jgi:hypothetical protein
MHERHGAASMEALGLDQSLCEKLKAVDINNAEDLKRTDLHSLCHGKCIFWMLKFGDPIN